MQHKRALLVREVPVRLVELSVSGCRITVDRQLEEKEVGRLCVTLHGNDYQDTVHVVRSAKQPGAHPTHTIGTTFVWATRPGAISIRGAVPQDSPD